MYLWAVGYFTILIEPSFIPFVRTVERMCLIEIILSSIVFNAINGAFLGYYFGFLQQDYAAWHLDFRFWIGFALWGIGLAVNWDADNILLRLKRSTPNDYQIPRSRLFSYVSCPNYLGEIVEHLGFAIMTWSVPALAFFIWTVANLLPRALTHHSWYQKTFNDYPIQRKAIFPFLL